MADNGYVTNKTVALAASRPEGMSWAGAWTGLVVGMAFAFLWTSLWAALGYGSDVGFFTGTAFGWWVAVTFIVSVFVGAAVATWVGRVERSIPSMLTGLTVWGLFSLGMLILGDTMVRAVGVVPPANAPAGNLQATLGANSYFLFGTTIVSAIAALMGSRAAGMMVAQKKPSEEPTAAAAGILPHAHVIDVRDMATTEARPRR